MFRYPLHLSPDAEGGYVVSFPDFPEAFTQGDTREAALAAAVDCLDEAIAARITQRLDIPDATSQFDTPSVEPTALIALKAGLYQIVKTRELSGVALARQLNVAETEVRRLLDPKHGTRLERLEEALQCFGKRVRIQLVDDQERPC